MTILRTKSETIADADKFILQNACIDNKGTVYAGYNSDKILIGLANSETRTLTVQLSNGQSEQVFVSPGHDNDVVYVAGMYREGNEKQAGIFSQNLDPNDFSLSTPIETAFPMEIKEKMYDQLKNYRPKETPNFSEMIFSPLIAGNGQLHVLGKSKKIIETRNANTYLTRTVFGSFVYVHIGKTAAKFTIIPKAVLLQQDYYFYFPFKDKMLFFWKDVDENLNRDITEVDVVKNPKSVTFVGVISEDGTINTQIASQEPGLVSFTQALSPTLLIMPAPTVTVLPGLHSNLEIFRKSDFYWKTIQLKDTP
jgi:hypothetical protein